MSASGVPHIRRCAPGSRARLAVGLAALVAVLLAAAAILYGLEPAGSVLLPPCPFKVLTGLACPGCGSVRAVHQLLHGNLTAALNLNALAVALFPLVGFDLVSLAAGALLDRRPPRIFEAGRAGRIVLMAVVCFWVLRNVPVLPFSVLAP